MRVIDARVKLIDRQRAAAKLSHGELCRRAGVDPDTWRRLRTGERPPRASTVRRLKRAIDVKPPQRLPLLAALHRLAMMWLARELGADVEAIMRESFAVERGLNEAWRRASTVRRYAASLVVTELDVPPAALGRAIGVSREGMRKALAYAEDQREAEPELDALFERCGRLLRGVA
ncbi:MAG TPA: helix-turn-helix transcriptional regulator [Burkholderiaceae bacterium]|nr:helix-turn-helix transcriptional regulator [Burkholderiaceae bacterium]